MHLRLMQTCCQQQYLIDLNRAGTQPFIIKTWNILLMNIKMFEHNSVHKHFRGQHGQYGHLSDPSTVKWRAMFLMWRLNVRWVGVMGRRLATTRWKPVASLRPLETLKINDRIKGRLSLRLENVGHGSECPQTFGDLHTPIQNQIRSAQEDWGK